VVKATGAGYAQEKFGNISPNNLFNPINNRNVNMATLILRDTHRALEKKMESLDKLKKETSIKIREAASHGDLKENGEYHAAREEQSFIVRKTQVLQTHSPFKIIEYHEIETDQVRFGNKVTIREEGKDEAVDYYLLGPIEFELDLFPMVITYHSPFGQAIVGKKIDEDFTLEIRGKETKFTITAIEKIFAE
jgi:transcription elongation factor GreA